MLREANGFKFTPIYTDLHRFSPPLTHIEQQISPLKLTQPELTLRGHQGIPPPSWCGAANVEQLMWSSCCGAAIVDQKAPPQAFRFGTNSLLSSGLNQPPFSFMMMKRKIINSRRWGGH